LGKSASNLNRATERFEQATAKGTEAARTNIQNQTIASKKLNNDLNTGSANNLQKLNEVLKKAAGNVRDTISNQRSATAGQVKKIDSKINTIGADVKDLKKEPIIRDEKGNRIEDAGVSSQAPLTPPAPPSAKPEVDLPPTPPKSDPTK